MPWRSIDSKRDRCCVLLATLIWFVGIFAWGVSPAHAAKIYFGTQDTLRQIQDVSIKGPNGEELYLGFKFSTQAFVLPYTLSDDGYVLGVKGQDRYFRLSQAEIERFQAGGMLPSPLPTYEISALDYVMGHALWCVLIVIAVLTLVGHLRVKARVRKRAPALPYFQSGVEQHNNGNLNEAMADYTKAIEIDPTFAEALLNRGIIYEGGGYHEQAIAEFTKAINCNAPSVTMLAHFERSKAYEKIGYDDKVISDLTTVIKASKKAKGANLAGVYFSRGNALMRKGDHKGAIADYTQVIKQEPNAEVAYRARAEAYQQRGKTNLAQADYSAANRIAGGPAMS